MTYLTLKAQPSIPAAPFRYGRRVYSSTGGWRRSREGVRGTVPPAVPLLTPDDTDNRMGFPDTEHGLLDWQEKASTAKAPPAATKAPFWLRVSGSSPDCSTNISSIFQL